MKTISRLALGFALAAITAGSALAHAKLVSSDPKAGGDAKAQTTTLDLTFNEEIAGKLSGAAVTDSAGKVLAADTMAYKKDKALMVMLKAPLAAGTYKVDWHAVASDDGHKTTGTYSFTVK
jgi:methionine-rich copper-binding protein CopC